MPTFPSSSFSPPPPAGLGGTPAAGAVAGHLRPGEARKAPAQASITRATATRTGQRSSALEVLRLGNLPTELIAHIGDQLDNQVDLLALSHTATAQRDALRAPARTALADLSIPRITSPRRYAAARAAVRDMPEPLRAERIAALARKSRYSGERPVADFRQLAADLAELSPPHRGGAFATLTDMLRLMSVGDIPLERDQQRGHATLLKLALEMPAALRRAALTPLSQAWLPPACVASAENALAALGPG